MNGDRGAVVEKVPPPAFGFGIGDLNGDDIAALPILAAVAVAYVQFALQRPALFRVMFGEPCDTDSSERIAA